MSIFTDLYTKLNVTAITSKVGDISPYVRARDTDFPAITFEVPDEQFDRISTGQYRSVATAEIICMARSVSESEDIAALVRTTIVDDNCNVLDSISRAYEPGYDEDSVGLFMVTLNLTIYGE